MTRVVDLGHNIYGTLHEDGSATFQGDLQETDRIDLPKDRVDRLKRIFRDIKEEKGL